MQITIDNLSYTYSEKSKSLAVKALDGVSFTINEGDFFGIIGHTGSGKSTFVQHLNGLIKIAKNHGNITVGEYNLSDAKCNYKELRAKVGMVFQYPEYQLFAETVKDDVAFGLKNFYKGLTNEQVEEKVKRAIELVGLDYEEVKEKSPFDLSGGQKRRVAIAGVIVSSPEVLVLDEPAAGIDPQGRKEILDLLVNLHNSTVKTIILISHDMNLVAEYCNRAAVFSHGKLYKVGTPKEIFSDSKIVEQGLEVPDTAYIINQLKLNGMDVDCDLTMQGFIDDIVKKYSKGGAL